MLPYTATDLVEIIRREIDASASGPRVHTTAKTPGFFQQLRQRAAAGLSARR